MTNKMKLEIKQEELKVEKQKNPKHLAIILDGNRRFAKKLMLEPWRGHELGAEKIEKLLEWCKELEIRELTLYCFSLENFNRPKKEFAKLKNDKRVHDNKIKIKFVGRRDLFDLELQRIIKELEEITKDYNDYKINFALGYGGRQEIVEAIKKLVENGGEINEENLKKNLWLENEPDLIIRTGGEKRSSNFLPWQSIYSEWIFLEKMWPEFTKEDLVMCIDEFNARNRRFGK